VRQCQGDSVVMKDGYHGTKMDLLPVGCSYRGTGARGSRIHMVGWVTDGKSDAMANSTALAPICVEKI
jgi:hypothetical protein